MNDFGLGEEYGRNRILFCTHSLQDGLHYEDNHMVVRFTYGAVKEFSLFGPTGGTTTHLYLTSLVLMVFPVSLSTNFHDFLRR